MMVASSPPAPDEFGQLAVCVGCGSPQHTDFFFDRAVPVDVGFVLPSEQEACSARVGDITLAFCHECGLVWNRSFDPSQIAFRPGYAAGLHHSPLLRSFLDGLVDRLIRRHNLYGKDILEIGCGDGYMLRLLCERGGNRGIGIDPAAPSTGEETAGAGRVKFIRDFYSRRYEDQPCDFLCCQSVLEDIPRPAEFLADVCQLLRNRGAGAYFEVFYGSRAFEQQDTWSIHYEQCNYFGLPTLRYLFEHGGFEVLDSGVCPGSEQYIFVETGAGREHATTVPSGDAAHPLPAHLSGFAAAHWQKVSAWRQRAEAFRAERKTVVVWGSGGKGARFLNALGPDNGIRYVVDINPQRQGRFIAGSAHQIVAPEFLAKCHPDVVVLSNPIYESEIREQLASLGLQPQICWI